MNYKYWLNIRGAMLLILGFIVIPIRTTNAQPNSSSKTKEVQSTSTTPKPPKKKPQISTWEAILKLLKGQKEFGGSRGPICVISPGILDREHLIWSTKPFFLWRGVNSSFYIRVYNEENSEQKHELVWSQRISSKSLEEQLPSLIYTGPALAPNHSYDWELTISEQQTYLFKFRVMSLSEQKRIEVDLKALETNLKPEQPTSEEIALERAYFFAQRNLWSDAFRELYAVKNTSDEMMNKIQDLVDHSCK